MTSKPVIAKAPPRKTAQQVFNSVMAHLYRQNYQANSGSGVDRQCMYRTEAGLACGVGGLITDREYRDTFEGATADCLIANKDDPRYKTFPKTLSQHSDLLLDLQMLHDDHFEHGFTRDFRNLAVGVANMHNLDNSFVKSLRARRPHKSTA